MRHCFAGVLFQTDGIYSFKLQRFYGLSHLTQPEYFEFIFNYKFDIAFSGDLDRAVKTVYSTIEATKIEFIKDKAFRKIYA